jgi:hypothetical protein
MTDEDHDTAGGVRRIMAIAGARRRRRRWVLAPRSLVVAAFGSVELDLRDATTAAAVAEMQIVAVCGRVTLLVPPGADVELAGFSVVGSSDCAVGEGPAPAGLPPIRASALAVFGRVRVQSPPDGKAGPAHAPTRPTANRRSSDEPAPPEPGAGPVAPATSRAPDRPADDRGAPDVAAPLLAVPPRALALGELLRRALPVPVRVRRAPAPFPDEDRPPAVIAAYRDPGGRVVAAALADLPAAASLAAARTGDPAVGADGPTLAPEAVAAVQELLGAAAELLAPADEGGGAPAPLLAEVAASTDALPSEVARLIGAPAARSDLVIEVEGQPGGALSFLVAA